MGKAKNGILGAVNGKVGNLIWYTSNGENYVRTAGKRNVPLTPGEIINTSKMTLIMAFFRSIKPFLKAGFSNEAKGTNKNYHNIATSCNRKNAIKMVDGMAVIDYEKVLVSQGTGLEPQHPKVELAENFLTFSWDYDEQVNWSAGTDQAMMMAYFPDENFAIYEIAGAKRKTGMDKLEIPGSYQTKTMEIYLSFVSNDRESVATSVYLAEIN